MKHWIAFSILVLMMVGCLAVSLAVIWLLWQSQPMESWLKFFGFIAVLWIAHWSGAYIQEHGVIPWRRRS